MYDFYDKLVNIDLPRVRDFYGVNKNSFDSRGNFDLGVKEKLFILKLIMIMLQEIKVWIF